MPSWSPRRFAHRRPRLQLRLRPELRLDERFRVVPLARAPAGTASTCRRRSGRRRGSMKILARSSGRGAGPSKLTPRLVVAAAVAGALELVLRRPASSACSRGGCRRRSGRRSASVVRRSRRRTCPSSACPPRRPGSPRAAGLEAGGRLEEDVGEHEAPHGRHAAADRHREADPGDGGPGEETAAGDAVRGRPGRPAVGAGFAAMPEPARRGLGGGGAGGGCRGWLRAAAAAALGAPRHGAAAGTPPEPLGPGEPFALGFVRHGVPLL